MYKHADQDKWDGYMPNKAGWVQDDYYVSSAQDQFHCPKAYGYYVGNRRGHRFGIQKKIHRATSRGINVDSHHVGKTDI